MHETTEQLIRDTDRAADRKRRQKDARRHYRDDTFRSFTRAVCGTFSLESLQYADDIEQVTCRGCRRCLELRRARLCGSSVR